VKSVLTIPRNAHPAGGQALHRWDVRRAGPWHPASPQSASCSENSAIRPEVSGRTL